MINYGSRYETAIIEMITDASGDMNVVAFRSDSPLAAPTSYSTYLVKTEDRLDVLAYQMYQREDYYWLIADANPGVPLYPLVAGTILRIPNVIG